MISMPMVVLFWSQVGRNQRDWDSEISTQVEITLHEMYDIKAVAMSPMSRHKSPRWESLSTQDVSFTKDKSL